MPEGSDPDAPNLPMLRGVDDPSGYESQSAKERFAVAKFYGMGSDGEWTVSEIAESLDVTERQVYRYLNESQIGQETRQILATTEAEWRLDMAMQLRREVKWINETLEDLRDRKTAVATAFETKTVEGTPTGDRNISLSDHSTQYRLKLPVPTSFETVTDYGSDIESLQAEKRRYLEQISKLLGLDQATQKGVDEGLAARSDEVKIVEIRQSDDPYPEAEPVDIGEAQDAEDAEEEASAGPDSDVIDIESPDEEDGPDD